MFKNLELQFATSLSILVFTITFYRFTRLLRKEKNYILLIVILPIAIYIAYRLGYDLLKYIIGLNI